MERGRRPDARYYGPEPPAPATRHRWGEEEEEEQEEGQYEGPTIFDKVFRRSARMSKESSRYWHWYLILKLYCYIDTFLYTLRSTGTGIYWYRYYAK
jgi:hypothetical protein